MNSIEHNSEKALSSLEILNQNLENWKPNTDEEKIALEIVKELQNGLSDQDSEPSSETKKGEAYFVGGYARGLAMHTMQDPNSQKSEFAPHDIDIVTNLTPDEAATKLDQIQQNLLAIYPDATINLKTKNAGQRFQVLIINIDISFPNDPNKKTIKKIFEVAGYRTERDYHGTKPSKVEPATSLAEDLQRRDFTINAMAFDPIAKKIVDPLNALEDLTNGELKFVGDMEARLKEDPSRVLRMVRFANKYDMTWDKDALKDFVRSNPDILSEDFVRDEKGNLIEEEVSTKEKPKYIPNISREQKKKELERILVSPNGAFGINDLAQLGLLKELLPEIVPRNPDHNSEEYQAFLRNLRSINLLNHNHIREILCQQMGLSFKDTPVDTYLSELKKHYGNGLFYTLLLQNNSLSDLPPKPSKQSTLQTKDEGSQIDSQDTSPSSILTILTNQERGTIEHFLNHKEDWDILYSDNEELEREKTYDLLIESEAKTVALATFIRKVSKLESSKQIEEAIQNFKNTQDELEKAIKLWHTHKQDVQEMFKKQEIKEHFSQLIKKAEILPDTLSKKDQQIFVGKITQTFEYFLYKHPEVNIYNNSKLDELFVKKLSELQAKENFNQITTEASKPNLKTLEILLDEVMQESSNEKIDKLSQNPQEALA
jgi:tRNA nucleotidyltransferase/poly(A) polymerase